MRIETTTATVWLDENGIIQAVFHPGADDTVETAKENIRAGIDVSGGTPRPLLLDMTKLRSMNKPARDYYARGDMREGAEKGVALLVGSALSRIIGNFFIGLNKSTQPVRLFTSREQAFTWLRGFLDDKR